MILIDTIFINNGGGKILLDYLYETLEEKTEYNVTFLIDGRLKEEYDKKKNRHIKHIFISGFFERNRFYRNNDQGYSTILCFGNLPPNRKVAAKVYTYFHQRIYLEIPKEFSYLERIKFNLKILVFRTFKKNTNFWLVQSDLIKEGLQQKFKIKPEKVLKIPFYPSFTGKKILSRIDNSFIYISNANPHKNHIKLIDAFCKYYKRFKKGQLTLTVSRDFLHVFEYIEAKKKEGFPIENIGFVKRDDLYQYYQGGEYLIFPSLSESYGLGIVEAVENGCKVLGADLPYLYEVCKPSLVFNPHDVMSIYECFCFTQSKENIPKTTLKTNNQINDLINLLVR